MDTKNFDKRTRIKERKYCQTTLPGSMRKLKEDIENDRRRSSRIIKN